MEHYTDTILWAGQLLKLKFKRVKVIPTRISRKMEHQM